MQTDFQGSLDIGGDDSSYYQTSGEEVKTSVNQRRKVRVFVRKGIRKRILFVTIPSHSQSIAQPRRGSARSHGVLLLQVVMKKGNIFPPFSLKIKRVALLDLF